MVFKCIIAQLLIASLWNCQITLGKCHNRQWPRFTLLKKPEVPTHPRDGQMDVLHMTKDYTGGGKKSAIEENKPEEWLPETTSGDTKENKEEPKQDNEEVAEVEGGGTPESESSEGAEMRNGDEREHTAGVSPYGSNIVPPTNTLEGEKTKLKDDVPLSTMQGSSAFSKVENMSKNVTSHHTGDTSTYVTNNFYNPPVKADNSLTSEAQLQLEYLWKRILDIDSKLLAFEPIPTNTHTNAFKRKGLIITFDPDSDPNKNIVTLDSNGIPIAE